LPEIQNPRQFVSWFRHSSPYINAFRGRVFVISFDGEAVMDEGFADLIHDIALLHSLGIRLILVHGGRPQIEQRLRERGATIEYRNGLRITDEAAIECVKEAAGAVRVQIEALLSMGLANSPMAGARIRVASGNLVTARPLGIHDGVDYKHTGVVRKIDVQAIQQRLDDNAIVLLSPIGYSPTGEVFNLSAAEVASSTAAAVKAEKLVSLVEAPGLRDSRKRLIRQLTIAEAESLLARKRKASGDLYTHLQHALNACRRGVRRAHIISRRTGGAVLLELFSRDGIGTMVTSDTYEGRQQATIDDVGGILALIEPLENKGILVKRSRELLEAEIDHFTLVKRDGAVIACAALYPFPQERAAELACLAVDPDYWGSGYAQSLLEHVERKALQQGIHRLFVLTTQTLHWFQERGFRVTEARQLPVKRQVLYNYQRKSKVWSNRCRPSPMSVATTQNALLTAPPSTRRAATGSCPRPGVCPLTGPAHPRRRWRSQLRRCCRCPG